MGKIRDVLARCTVAQNAAGLKPHLQPLETVHLNTPHNTKVLDSTRYILTSWSWVKVLKFVLRVALEEWVHPSGSVNEHRSFHGSFSPIDYGMASVQS